MECYLNEAWTERYGEEGTRWLFGLSRGDMLAHPDQGVERVVAVDGVTLVQETSQLAFQIREKRFQNALERIALLLPKLGYLRHSHRLHVVFNYFHRFGRRAWEGRWIGKWSLKDKCVKKLPSSIAVKLQQKCNTYTWGERIWCKSPALACRKVPVHWELSRELCRRSPFQRGPQKPGLRRPRRK